MYFVVIINTSILKYMLYFAMIDIINDEKFTFVLNYFTAERRRKSTPKREKFVCSSSDFHMSDIDEYEEDDDMKK